LYLPSNAYLSIQHHIISKMAQTLTEAQVVDSLSPYQLDPEQTLRASKALLSHLRTETARLKETSTKKDLLKSDDAESEKDDVEGADVPIWLNLSTKQHVADRNRLKPSRVAVPHSLNSSPSRNICLITADPQRSVKNTVTDLSFPTSLSSRINRIIGFTKLKSRYKTFEQRRQLLSEHDIFLADDRIINRLPDTLGKVFYKGTSKRPIPINIAQREPKDEKKVDKLRNAQKPKGQKDATFAPPSAIAKEIEGAINSIPVNLRPGTLVVARVGLASFTPEQLNENLQVAVTSIIQKHVAKGWKNVKGIHIKSPSSIAMPLWLADELWVHDENVEEVVDDEISGNREATRKRKRNPKHTKGPQVGRRKRSKLDDATEEERVDALRKEKLAVQKASAFQAEGIAA
jgi:ribosome biogenesis protein UTP30